MRRVAARARALWVVSVVEPREASSSTTIAPTLWRFPAYFGPGFPSPTTSQVPSLPTGGKYAGRPGPSWTRPSGVVRCAVAQASADSAFSPSAAASPDSAFSLWAASSDSSRSIPASSSASASSASSSSCEICWVMLTTRVSSSTTRAAPRGSSTSEALICVPASRPSTETTRFSGMWVASTSSCRVWASRVTTVSGAASPSRCTGTSTVTFSPLRTMTRSTCSMTGLIGSRCTSLARAICSSPSMTMVSRALAVLSAIMVSWPGSVMCTGSAPWPYMTAGILWSRRILRAAPLPNCVRFSATSLRSVSDTGTPVGDSRMRWASTRGAARRPHRVESRTRRLAPCGVPRRGNPESLGDARGQREIRLVGSHRRAVGAFAPELPHADGDDPRHDADTAEQLDETGELAEQQPGEEHREQHLRQAHERGDRGAEDARGGHAQQVCRGRGHERELADRRPPGGPAAQQRHVRGDEPHRQHADEPEHGEDQRTGAHPEPGEGDRRQVAVLGREDEEGGQPRGRHQAPADAHEVRTHGTAEVEHQHEPREREHDAEAGERAGRPAGADPHDEDHEDDSEVLEQQRHPDVEPLHRVEVGDLAPGDGHRSVREDGAQVLADQRPPAPQREHRRHGQHEAGARHAEQDDGTGAPALDEQRLGERATAAERGRGGEGQPEADALGPCHHGVLVLPVS